MDQEQQPWWRKQVLWPVVLAAAVAFLIIVICGYLFGWGWTGLPEKTLWDWLSLLIVPVVLAIGGYLLNSSQTRATQEAAERRAQDEAMQAYLDDMTELMMKYHLRAPPPEEDLADVHVVAQARTVTVLRGMDAMHKRDVLHFLHSASLINTSGRVVSLSHAPLSRVDLSEGYLPAADLSDAVLSEANLAYAQLSEANLRGADLSGADLADAVLSGANLSGANLSGANLSGANLSGATHWTMEQLGEAELQDGASFTMPDGSKASTSFRNYEEGLKHEEGRGEDGENSDPS